MTHAHKLKDSPKSLLIITSETQQYTMKRLAAMITLLCYYYTQLLKIHRKISSTVVEQ